jgi:hypothetical protein
VGGGRGGRSGLGSYNGPIRIIIDKGRIVVIAQDDYDYVRIRVSSTRLSDVLHLESAYGGSRYSTQDSFIWTAATVESLRLIAADMSEHVALSVQLREILNILYMYCASIRGSPRSYTARTLNGILGGESVAFMDMM